MQMWRQDMKLSQRAGETEFSFYGQEDEPLVEGVSQFQYLGRILDHSHNDWPSVHRNIGKARAVW